MRGLSLFTGMFIAISLVFTASCVTKEFQVTETYYETEYRTEYRTESYTETEYIVVDTVEGKEYITPRVKWQTGLYFRAVGSGIGMTYYYGYEISTAKHSRRQVKIRISPGALEQKGYIGVYNLTGVGQIPPKPGTLGARITKYSGWELSPFPEEQAWLDSLNAVLTDRERILCALYIGAGGEDQISFDAQGITNFAIFVNSWHQYAISSVNLIWSDDIIEQRITTKERQVAYQVPVQVEKQRTLTETKKIPIWEAILGE